MQEKRSKADRSHNAQWRCGQSNLRKYRFTKNLLISSHNEGSILLELQYIDFLGQGKPLARDVTVSDIFADSHIDSTSAGSWCRSQVEESKYADIMSTQLLYPVTAATAGAYDVGAVELTKEIGRCIVVTEDNIHHYRDRKRHLNHPHLQQRRQVGNHRSHLICVFRLSFIS